jgi:hypothetical protein
MKSKWMRVFGGLALLAIASVAMLALPGQNQNFSISAFPPMATARAGAAANYTAVVDSQGFEGRVTLTCQSSSPGVGCSISPSSVQLNPALASAAHVRAVAASNAQKGSYQLTITAMAESAGTEKSTTVTLYVN